MTLPELVELDTEELEVLEPFPLKKQFFESNPPKGTEPIVGGEPVIFPVEQEVESRIGKDWRKIVALLVPTSRIQGIIKIEQGEGSEAVERKIGQTTTTLFLMGWELGRNIDSFANVIADRLRHQGMFKSQLFNSGEGIQTYRDLCMGILQAGALAKQRFTGVPVESQLVMKI